MGKELDLLIVAYMILHVNTIKNLNIQKLILLTNMRKILKKLYVIQQKKDAYGYERSRFNPYNPLSYIVIILMPVVAILLLGIIGLVKEVDFNNPFKYK